MDKIHEINIGSPHDAISCRITRAIHNICRFFDIGKPSMKPSRGHLVFKIVFLDDFPKNIILQVARSYLVIRQVPAFFSSIFLKQPLGVGIFLFSRRRRKYRAAHSKGKGESQNRCFCF